MFWSIESENEVCLRYRLCRPFLQFVRSVPFRSVASRAVRPLHLQFFFFVFFYFLFFILCVSFSRNTFSPVLALKYLFVRCFVIIFISLSFRPFLSYVLSLVLAHFLYSLLPRFFRFRFLCLLLFLLLFFSSVFIIQCGCPLSCVRTQVPFLAVHSVQSAIVFRSMWSFLPVLPFLRPFSLSLFVRFFIHICIRRFVFRRKRSALRKCALFLVIFVRLY
jgi:hypothetical protein